MPVDAECFVHISETSHASIDVRVNIRNILLHDSKDISKFLESELLHLHIISLFGIIAGFFKCSLLIQK
jgi:hypothetical protein